MCAWVVVARPVPGVSTLEPTSMETASPPPQGLHTEFATELYACLVRPLPEETVRSIVAEAVGLEQEFCCEALRCADLSLSQVASQTGGRKGQGGAHSVTPEQGFPGVPRVVIPGDGPALAPYKPSPPSPFK